MYHVPTRVKQRQQCLKGLRTEKTLSPLSPNNALFFVWSKIVCAQVAELYHPFRDETSHSFQPLIFSPNLPFFSTTFFVLVQREVFISLSSLFIFLFLLKTFVVYIPLIAHAFFFFFCGIAFSSFQALKKYFNLP